ncbi:MAG: heme-binding beta-barrel domain-containing protein [Caulobacteraceae bacterium]|nr:heme-binding beta-barrel domain-containing protein [Caulobacteraceae bacterium]
MSEFPDDIYTEPAEVDPDTLSNLGPLRPLAGIWEGIKGLDVNPKPEGPERQAFIERMELQPIDPQANGPQLLYGLHYVTRIVKPGEVETYHHQTGYWLWEPATGVIMQTLAIPRAQVALAGGRAAADATQFEVSARRGDTAFGICSGPFLEHAFRTDSYRIVVTVNPDGSWSYDEVTVLVVRGQSEPFMHTDRNTLRRIGDPTPNPLMRG